MNVNNSGAGRDGADLKRFFKGFLICAFLFWVGRIATHQLPDAYQEQTQLISFIAGVMATMAYNLVMLLLVANKPPISTNARWRLKVFVLVFLLNATLLLMIVGGLLLWPEDTAAGFVLSPIHFSADQLTPDLMSKLQMVGICCFGAVFYVVLSAMAGIQNILVLSPKPE